MAKLAIRTSNFQLSYKLIKQLRSRKINFDVIDPAEKLLPDIGVIKVRDPESGSSFWIDTSNRVEMEKLKNQINSDFDTFNKQAKKIGFDIISVSTNGDFVDPLISLFRKRDKR